MRSLPPPRDSSSRRIRRFWVYLFSYISRGHGNSTVVFESRKRFKRRQRRSETQKRAPNRPRRRFLRRTGKKVGKMTILQLPGGQATVGALEGARKMGNGFSRLMGLFGQQQSSAGSKGLNISLRV